MQEHPKNLCCHSARSSTHGALTALRKAGQAPLEFISHHARGDWGKFLTWIASKKLKAVERLRHGVIN